MLQSLSLFYKAYFHLRHIFWILILFNVQYNIHLNRFLIVIVYNSIIFYGWSNRNAFWHLDTSLIKTIGVWNIRDISLILFFLCLMLFSSSFAIKCLIISNVGDACIIKRKAKVTINFYIHPTQNNKILHPMMLHFYEQHQSGQAIKIYLRKLPSWFWFLWKGFHRRGRRGEFFSLTFFWPTDVDMLRRIDDKCRSINMIVCI